MVDVGIGYQQTLLCTPGRVCAGIVRAWVEPVTRWLPGAEYYVCASKSLSASTLLHQVRLFGDHVLESKCAIVASDDDKLNMSDNSAGELQFLREFFRSQYLPSQGITRACVITRLG